MQWMISQDFKARACAVRIRLRREGLEMELDCVESIDGLFKCRHL